MKKKLRVACLLGAIFLMFTMSQLSFGVDYWEDCVWIFARWVDGFGSNHGWHDVDKAEGYLGYSREWENGDFAWKYLDVDLYARLLKAYDFERWVPEDEIADVYAWVDVAAYYENCGGNCPEYLQVQVRVYDGTEVIANYTDTVGASHDYPYINEILVNIPTPSGGWTKEKVDNLQVWVGSKERKNVYLRVYDFRLVAYYP